MLYFTDHLQNKIELTNFPKRIVSLVPSQTELLCDLGLENEVVGITRFCVHPKKWRSTKAIIGGTKKFDFEVIEKLQPDLIIGNKEENYQEGITRLQQKFSVWMSDIYNIDDTLKTITDIGNICNRKQEAKILLNEILSEKLKFKTQNSNPFKDKTAAYFIWKKPYMVASSNTFINAMLNEFGIKNLFGNFERYPEFSEIELKNLQPDFVFLSSEPYQFTEKHFQEFQTIFPNAKIVLVDGEMFSWYGSRIKQSYKYFKELSQKLL